MKKSSDKTEWKTINNGSYYKKNIKTVEDWKKTGNPFICTRSDLGDDWMKPEEFQTDDINIEEIKKEAEEKFKKAVIEDFHRKKLNQLLDHSKKTLKNCQPPFQYRPNNSTPLYELDNIRWEPNACLLSRIKKPRRVGWGYHPSPYDRFRLEKINVLKDFKNYSLITNCCKDALNPKNIKNLTKECDKNKIPGKCLFQNLPYTSSCKYDNECESSKCIDGECIRNRTEKRDDKCIHNVECESNNCHINNFCIGEKKVMEDVNMVKNVLKILFVKTFSVENL